MHNRTCNVYDESLRVLESCSAANDSCNSAMHGSKTRLSDRVTPLLELVQNQRENIRLLGKARTLENEAMVAWLLESSGMTSFTQDLVQAEEAMRSLMTDHGVLAARLKDMSAKQTLPVEPQLQRQLNLFLLEAARASRGLQESHQQRQNVLWASTNATKPMQWEDDLRPLNQAVDETQRYTKALIARNAAISKVERMLTL